MWVREATKVTGRTHRTAHETPHPSRGRSIDPDCRTPQVDEGDTVKKPAWRAVHEPAGGRGGGRGFIEIEADSAWAISRIITTWAGEP